MNKLILVPALALSFLAGASVTPSFAANARHPYQNVNKANDKGNDTGDAEVERLNAAQLGSIRGGSAGMTSPAVGAPSMGADQKTLGGQK